MVERSRRHYEYRRLTLANFVPLETMMLAEFNYYEPSITDTKDDVTWHYHISEISKYNGYKEKTINLNIVIAEGLRHKKSVIFHFGKFEAKPRGESTPEEAKEYDKKLEEILDKKNRVYGRKLNGLMLDTLRRFDSVRFGL